MPPLFALSPNSLLRARATNGEPTPSHMPRSPSSHSRSRSRSRSPLLSSLPLRRPSLPLRPPRLSLGESQHTPDTAPHPPTQVDGPTTATGPTPAPQKRTLGVGERELLVLVHGLQGAVEDFNYLLETLGHTSAHRDGKLVLHATRVNTDRTHDGIAAGARRVADDIRAVVEREARAGRPIHVLSLLGFSLGGLYVRHAVAQLFDRASGLVAGVRAGSLLLVASPHLGVRRFGVYRFLPEALRHAPVLGETVREIMLVDDGCLLERMSRDTAHMPFVSALEAFEERVLYANLRNDFMVNYGTAALDVDVTAVGGGEVDRVIERYSPCAVDEAYDDKGCKICFRYWDDGATRTPYHQTTVADNSLKRARTEGSSLRTARQEEEEEERMARRLRKVGWWVIGVDFPLALPIAHNRIVAMSRNVIHTWLNAPGRRVVHHLVDVINEHFDGHSFLFRTSLGAAGVAGIGTCMDVAAQFGNA